MNAPYYNGEPGDTDVCTEDANTCECPECRTWRDNREPGDPDGETYRGGEAADQMATLRNRR